MRCWETLAMAGEAIGVEMIYDITRRHGTKYDKPFSHAVFENFITPELVRQINAEWPEEWQHKEAGKFTKKWSTPKLGAAAQLVADSIDIGMVEEVTGIKNLIADPSLSGAGLHCIPTTGFLKMHCDFNTHVEGWHRRVNLLIYLNEVWKDKWNGHLQLGLGPGAIKIAPLGGRCVIFETNDKSWHGHPELLRCPENVQRRSLALYYYTKEPPPDAPHTTIYQRDEK